MLLSLLKTLWKETFRSKYNRIGHSARFKELTIEALDLSDFFKDNTASEYCTEKYFTNMTSPYQHIPLVCSAGYLRAVLTSIFSLVPVLSKL